MRSIRNLKKITFLLALIVALFSFTASSINVQAKLTDNEDKFIKTITKDFIATHNLNLDSYNFFDLRDIYLNKDNLTTQEKSIINIYMSIVKKQDYIDCSPLLYVNETDNKGYVLEKKVNGMNNLHILSYDNENQIWKVTNKNNKMGKDIVELGLLKNSK